MKWIGGVLVPVVLVMLSPAHADADSLAAKRFILEKYVTPLPDSIAYLPWSEFAKYVDPHTHLLSQSESRMWTQRFAGHSDGQTGIDYEWVPHGWIVTEIAPNSPAYAAGLLPGDIVSSVNGRAPRWRDANGQYGSIYGDVGSVFVMEVLRGGACHTIGVPLADYRTESIYVTVVGRTMCVVVLDFNFGVTERFRALTASIREEEIDTVILDLRNNAGGAVSEATDLLSEFVPTGDTILLERYRDGHEYTVSTGDGRWRRPRPLYVLISEGTVSAGEVFSGGMKVRTNAVMIGSRTYGKGRMQRFYQGGRASSFSDSTIAGAKVTIGIYLAGGTLEVDSIGVLPEMEADLSLAPVVTLPQTINAAALRRRYPWPTLAIIDSINRIVGHNVGHMIWCERALTYEAYRAVDTMRQWLITRVLPPRPEKVIAGLYTIADEAEIRSSIRESYGNVLDPYTLEVMPVLRQIDRLKVLSNVKRPVRDALEDDATSAVSADLGMALGWLNNVVCVISVLPSSSAYDAGICVGDQVLAMNGKPLAKDLDAVRLEIIEWVRSGQFVRFKIRRGNLTFTSICEPVMRVTSMPLSYLDGEVGYIASDRFCATQNNVFQIWRAMLQMRDSGMRRVVFDLRGSQHGSVDNVMKLLGYFSRGSFMVTTVWDNSGKKQKLSTSGEGTFDNLPVQVIVDGSTKGAAEIFAEAMRRRGNARIVGTPTAGQLYERRTLEVTPTLALRYVWRRFASVKDSTVIPDVLNDLTSADPHLVSQIASHLGNIAQWRKGNTSITDARLDNIIQSLPPQLRSTPRNAIAQAIFGEGARLYNLAKMMRGTSDE